MQAKLDIPSRFIIHETVHWVLNHRMNSALPGYLILSARAPFNSLAALPVEAQAELGILMARTQQVMEAQLQPARLYMHTSTNCLTKIATRSFSEPWLTCAKRSKATCAPTELLRNTSSSIRKLGTDRHTRRALPLRASASSLTP